MLGTVTFFDVSKGFGFIKTGRRRQGGSATEGRTSRRHVLAQDPRHVNDPLGGRNEVAARVGVDGPGRLAGLGGEPSEGPALLI